MAQDAVKQEEVSDEAAMPTVNGLIRVALYTTDDVEGHPYVHDIPSRIEDIAEPVAGTPRELLIAAPRYEGNLALPAEGGLAVLTWPTQRGLMELPVHFAGTTTLGVLQVWRMHVAGPALRTERRKYFRVTVCLPVRVALGTGSVGVGIKPSMDLTLAGHTVDLSEGGLRCLVPGPPLAPGASLMIWLQVEDSQMELQATVVRSDPAENDESGEGLCETSLRFIDAGQHADAMRRIVFTQQLRARQNPATE